MTTTKRKESKAKPQRQRGRPARPYPKIPDTFENVVKALVQPVKEGKPRVVGQFDGFGFKRAALAGINRRDGRLPDGLPDGGELSHQPAHIKWKLG